jgi:hypothetical protein
MSAAEIIEQIKALPLEEQREVSQFVRAHVDTKSEAAGATGVRYADDETFNAAVERVFERHEELFKKLAE